MNWFTLCLIVSVLILLILWTRRPKNYPPGPTIFPLLGTLPALAMTKSKTRQDKLWELSRQYGEVLGLYLGTKPMVAVNGYAAVKQVLNREDLAFRPTIIPVSMRSFGKRLGLINIDGPFWREQRRFTIRHLRDFGFGKLSMEAFIHGETLAMINVVDSGISDKNFDLIPFISILAINALWTIMSGKRHDFDDENFLKLTQNVLTYFRYGNLSSPVTFSSILQKIPIINSSYMKQRAAAIEIRRFIQHSVDEHLETYDENHMRDFMDVYIKEMKHNPNSSFSIDQLCALCIDLFNAGTETTSSTLAYSLRYMVQYPRVQDEMRQELYRVIGTERLPGIEDAPKLHYCQAVVAEIFRHSGVLPFTPPHATASDTTLMGFDLPKGTIVLPNLWSVHMDLEIWGDPENFRPERFISDSIYTKSEYLMQFGQGPRMCVGEPLARHSTLLFLTALVQKFTFATRGPVPSDEQLPGFTTTPAPFRMTIARVN